MKLFIVKFKKNRNWKAFLYLIICLLFLFLADYLFFLPRIYPGISMHHIQLGGKTEEQVGKSLEEMAVVLTGPRADSTEVPLHDLGIFPSAKRFFAEAYRHGRIKGGLPHYPQRWVIMREGVNVPLPFEIDRAVLQQQLSGLENIFNCEPENAYFRVNRGEQHAELIPEQPGYRLNRDELYEDLVNILKEPESPLTLTVPCTEIAAEITEKSFREKGIEGLMSSFSTRYDSAKADRAHNIELAASRIDGYIIAPEKMFSLNAVLGNTTTAKGYREAPVIMGGELRMGVGGGVCQISSTLYNAVIMADLPVVERHNHGLKVAYLPPGRDATIEYGARDLKFRNNTEQYIMINTAVRHDILTVSLLGQPSGREVKITRHELNRIPPPVRYRYDPDLAPGEEETEAGTPGYLVEVWKTVYENGQAISRRRISVDSYSPNPTVVRYGPSE